MASDVLNPTDPVSDAPAATDAVELSCELVHAARALSRHDHDEPGQARRRLERAASALRAVDPARMADDERRFAFWLNVYNALVRDVLVREGARGSLLFKLGLFARAAYQIGGRRYSLELIEHGLLRHNRRPPSSPFRVARADDARLAHGPRRFDPRVHFALNCGARSCPPVRAYDAVRLEAQLDLATRAYVEAETRVDPRASAVELPRLCKYYAGDFGSATDAVRFAARHLPPPDGPWLEQNAARVRVRYAGYDWSIVES